MHPNGSINWIQLKDWAEDFFKVFIKMKLPLKPQLKPSWTTLVEGNRYPDLWLRYYALLRHHESCMVLCSDYANHAPPIKSFRSCGIGGWI